MACARIKELLSEYIDGTLGAQAKADVEEHISTCKACREELASVSAIVRELRSLEPVRAPADFLESLHERLEPRFSFDKIVQKLFVPLRIKIPLELAAAAAVAVLVISVLSIEQKETRMLKAPIVSTHESLEEESIMAHSKPASEKEAKRPAPVLEKAEQWQAAREAEPIELVLLLKRAGRDKADRSGEGIGAAPRSEGAPEEDRARPGAIGRKALVREQALDETMKAEELKEKPSEPFQVAGKKADNLLSGLKDLIGRFEGKVLAVEYEEKTGQLETIYAEIPARHYGSFCEELRPLAALKAPPPALIEKDLETVRIRMKFVSSP